jgi:hypothetical protein
MSVVSPKATAFGIPASLRGVMVSPPRDLFAARWIAAAGYADRAANPPYE